MPSPDPEFLPPVLESQWVPEISDDNVAPDEPSPFKVRFPWEETGGHRVNARLASSNVPTTPLGVSEKTEQVVGLNTNSTYTCILIPCSPQHFLTGELADKLGLWVPELCSSFGWRLEGLAVRPEYLQWTVWVTPTVSPSGLVRIIRQNTSVRIFALSDKYRINNPGGDFWAPGYLMVRGSQPPASQLLRSYIERTRRNQGIANT
jgi:REP element-mobilizing transposase RayT